jgi:PST family polysaccharide transporter
MLANLTILGMQFKAISWAMGYIYLAKGDGELFLSTEIISGIVILIINLLGYYIYGLNGLGASFIITYFLGMIFSYLIINWKYHFVFPLQFFKKIFISYGFTVASFLCVFSPNTLLKYSLGIIVFILATFFSLRKLNALMDLKSLILSIIKR